VDSRWTVLLLFLLLLVLVLVLVLLVLVLLRRVVHLLSDRVCWRSMLAVRYCHWLLLLAPLARCFLCRGLHTPGLLQRFALLAFKQRVLSFMSHGGSRKGSYHTVL